MLFIFPGDTVILRFYFRFARRMTLLFCLNLEATTTTRKIDHIFYLPFAGAIAHNFIPHPKTISAEPSTFWKPYRKRTNESSNLTFCYVQAGTSCLFKGGFDRIFLRQVSFASLPMQVGDYRGLLWCRSQTWDRACCDGGGQVKKLGVWLLKSGCSRGENTDIKY